MLSSMEGLITLFGPEKSNEGIQATGITQLLPRCLYSVNMYLALVYGPSQGFTMKSSKGHSIYLLIFEITHLRDSEECYRTPL